METNEYTNHPHLGLIPSDWVVTNSSAVCTKITDGTHDTPTPTSSGLPYIKSVHIKKGTITFESSLFLSKEDHDIIYKRCNPEKGDLLVVNIGLGNIGECAYVDVDFEFSMKNIALLKPNPKRLDGKYLYYYYESRKNRVVHATKTGGAQPFLSIKDLKKLKLVVPPLPEQRKIAEILSTWDKAITTTEKLIETSKQQKKALMQQLLTGKKRLVNPDTGKVFEGEWEEVHLSDIAGIKKGKALSAKNVVDGSFPVIAGGKTSPYNHNQFTHSEIITVSASGSYAGYVSYHPYKIWASDCSVVSTRVGNDIGFIFQWLQLNQNRIYSLQSGGAQPHIYPKDLEVLKLLKPKLNEQKKIASVLTVADKEIEILTAKLAHFKQEKKALMQQLLTGKRRVKIDEVEVA
ncbi:MULTISPECIES: restriction endonuclease subunit S [Vibrio]|uniref:restriction endonuclease subunit S n=1 Tax=Vibrio TaxID=662 RepID=UPI00352C8F91